MLVVREGTEGPYIEAGGFMRKGTPAEVATQESINTAFGVGRAASYALQRAAERPRRKLTLVHKSNVLAYAGDLWRRAVTEAAAAFPEVTTEYCHMDAAAVYFLTQPERPSVGRQSLSMSPFWSIIPMVALASSTVTCCSWHRLDSWSSPTTSSGGRRKKPSRPVKSRVNSWPT